MGCAVIIAIASGIRARGGGGAAEDIEMSARGEFTFERSPSTAGRIYRGGARPKQRLARKDSDVEPIFERREEKERDAEERFATVSGRQSIRRSACHCADPIRFSSLASTTKTAIASTMTSGHSSMSSLASSTLPFHFETEKKDVKVALSIKNSGAIFSTFKPAERRDSGNTEADYVASYGAAAVVATSADENVSPGGADVAAAAVMTLRGPAWSSIPEEAEEEAREEKWWRSSSSAGGARKEDASGSAAAAAKERIPLRRLDRRSTHRAPSEDGATPVAANGERKLIRSKYFNYLLIALFTYYIFYLLK